MSSENIFIGRFGFSLFFLTPSKQFWAEISKSKSEISSYFNDLSLNDPVNIVFSCGSGITACVLALAYSQVNNKYSPVIYDGSWAEYGKI